MATTSPNDLIRLALKKAGVTGVGQTPLGEDTNDAYDELQLMLAQWARKRWLIWHLVDVGFTSTGAASYTVATGGNFNVARPDRLEGAYVRQTNGGQNVDTPLRVLQAREDYARIAVKSVTGMPSHVFYDAAFPTGVLYPWPVPPASIYQLRILLKEALPQFTSLGQSINLPLEYKDCILYNLARRLRTSYRLKPDPEINDLANAALGTIRSANTQIPQLRMPAGLSRGGAYDITSDR